jgi:hypothetical protein
MRISYSSSGLFQGCQRKFYHKKINHTDIDPDCEEDTTALRVGKAFHEVLESCMHVKEDCTHAMVQEALNNNDITDLTQAGLVIGMVRKYFDLHKKQGLKTIGVELEIGDDNVIGYVDAVMVDPAGGWYIVDLKTAGRLNNSLLSRLKKDPQLNIYSFYKDQLARALSLDPDKFSGTRYRVTTKATIKKNRKESTNEFIERVYNRVESYDIFIPKSELIPENIYAHFINLKGQMERLAEVPEEKIPQNFGNCEMYFKPCEYWSRCYGKTFTSAAEDLQLFDSTNAETIDPQLIDDDIL